MLGKRRATPSERRTTPSGVSLSEAEKGVGSRELMASAAFPS